MLAIRVLISYFTINFTIITAPMNQDKKWPQLDFDKWKDTLYTVQMWTQIVGKIRLRNLPWLNHSWHATLHVSPTGLTTNSINYGDGLF
ncbi:MAG: DUF5996 family protein, partial [Segetibacter sp.]